MGQLCALHEGPLGDWIVYLAADENRAWVGRDLLSVLTELFDLPHGRKEAWVYALIENLAGRETALGVRHPCPCCDFLTLSEPPSGTFQLCPVCWWEDDNIQFATWTTRAAQTHRACAKRARACSAAASASHASSNMPARQLPDEMPDTVPT